MRGRVLEKARGVFVLEMPDYKIREVSVLERYLH